MSIRNNKEEYNAYMRIYHIKRYRRLRNEALIFLGGKCTKCGSLNKLELDHIDRETKSIEVSQMLNVSLKKFWNEVKKCQILCRPCHIEKTILERGYKIAKGTHGTLSSYRYCKCEICKKVHNAYCLQWKRKNRAAIVK